MQPLRALRPIVMRNLTTNNVEEIPYG